jgi:hypothetical protein
MKNCEVVRFLIGALLIAISLSTTSYSQPNALYWSYNSPNGPQPVVMQASIDGSSAHPLPIFGGGGERPIAVDSSNGNLFVGYSGTITRYDLDGTNPIPIFSTSTNPNGVSGIAVDSIHDKLYWSYNSPNGPQPVVMQSNLDGSGALALPIFGGGGLRPIALDLEHGNLFVGYSGTITSYDLNGNNPFTVFNTSTNPSGLSGIAIDPIHDKLYWSYNSPNGPQPVVMQANLNGTGVQALPIFGGGGPRPIALDLINGNLLVGYSGTITRYDLSGNNPLVIFSTSTNPSGLSGIAIFVPEPTAIWLSGTAMVVACSLCPRALRRRA